MRSHLKVEYNALAYCIFSVIREFAHGDLGGG